MFVLFEIDKQMYCEKEKSYLRAIDFAKLDEIRVFID